jgi:hypothetical protein
VGDPKIIDELDLVRRALALRKKRLIGVLYSYEHSYYIASDECDPFGSRTRVNAGPAGRDRGSGRIG